MHIVDRRLNPGGKSLENRQRFLRRAKALVQGRCRKSRRPRTSRMSWRAARSASRSTAWTSRVSARDAAARATSCCPATRSSSKATSLPRPERRAAAAAGRGRAARARTRSASCSRRDEFLDLFLDDLELPDLAKRKLARRSKPGHAPRRLLDVGLARQYLGQPHHAQSRLARRIALRRPRPEAVSRARGGARRIAATRRARTRADGRDRGAEGEDQARSPTSIRSTSATAASRPCRSRSRRR